MAHCPGGVFHRQVFHDVHQGLFSLGILVGNRFGDGEQVSALVGGQPAIRPGKRCRSLHRCVGPGHHLLGVASRHATPRFQIGGRGGVTQLFVAGFTGQLMDMSSLDFGETRGDELILVALDRDGNEVETEDLSLLWSSPWLRLPRTIGTV